MDKIILIELIEKGYSTYQIGKELNKGQSTVRFWLNKFGLKTRHKKIGDKDFDYSISGSNHEEGKTKINQKNLEFWKKFQDYMYDNHTWNECSKEFNVSIVTIAKAKKLGLIKTRSLTESVRYFVNHKETKEQRINRSLKAKDGIKNAKLNNVAFGGYRHGAGRGKKFKVIDAFNQPVCLQSSFEFKLFNILSELKINWIRPNYLPYTINNTNKKYFPDFLFN